MRTRDEAEVYRRLGMDWVPPELRENRGEIEAARAHALPDLVTIDQIRGDLHSHTDWSDGKSTLEEMVAEGDKVAARFTMRGTHLGTFFGTPSTGKKITVQAMNIYRLSGGQIIEETGQPDLLGLLQQIGAVPAN
jgi:predicted ester cyclase